jgi:uncharacterized membrane protein
VAPKTRNLSIELWISFVLRSGVIACALLLSFGLIKGFWIDRNKLDFSLIRYEAAGPTRVMEVFNGICRGDSLSILCLGLILLILLPYGRLLLMCLLFLYEKDYFFVFLCLAVLGILSSGIWIGFIA